MRSHQNASLCSLGSFNNYIREHDFVPFLPPAYLPLRGFFFTLDVNKNRYFRPLKYPPHLFHVVIERPFVQIIDGWPPNETSLSHWMIHVPIRLLSLISLGLMSQLVILNNRFWRLGTWQFREVNDFFMTR